MAQLSPLERREEFLRRVAKRAPPPPNVVEHGLHTMGDARVVEHLVQDESLTVQPVIVVRAAQFYARAVWTHRIPREKLPPPLGQRNADM